MSDKKKKTTLDESEIQDITQPTRRSFLTKTGVAAGITAAGVTALSKPASASDPIGEGSDRDPHDPYGAGSDRDPNDPIGEGTDYD